MTTITPEPDYTEELNQAMEHQRHNDKQLLIDTIFGIGLDVINNMEEDISIVELRLIKKFGDKHHYKEILAQELASYTQGKEQRYMEEHTSKELETTLEVVSGEKIS